MKCTNCKYEWEERIKVHKKQWRCPKCRILIHNSCPACSRSKLFGSKFCNRCSCKITARKRPSRLGVPTKKGGFYIDTPKNGSRTSYKMILCSKHPRAGKRNNYVPEHILIWEKEHKMYLPEGYIIHHINGDGLDNRMENLIAL